MSLRSVQTGTYQHLVNYTADSYSDIVLNLKLIGNSFVALLSNNKIYYVSETSTITDTGIICSTELSDLKTCKSIDTLNVGESKVVLKFAITEPANLCTLSFAGNDDATARLYLNDSQVASCSVSKEQASLSVALDDDLVPDTIVKVEVLCYGSMQTTYTTTLNFV